MAIDFKPERWKRIQDTSRLWWAGELDRPLITIPLMGRDPGRPEPPPVSLADMYNPSVTPESIVDRWDYELSCVKYVGDTFPHMWPNFGPGVLATALGGIATPSTDTVWFHPMEQLDITDIHFQYDHESTAFKRMKDIYKTAIERWQGNVQLDMTDLGGNLDIVSTFRPAEKLLLDLYDHPDEVKRLLWEAHHAWHVAFNDLSELLKPTNPGHTAWASIFSDEPYYMLQCDFCYMIGPDMFDEFVKPELDATCKLVSRPFYHLDGPGQIPHLDSLLQIPELKGIQWVPGSGSKSESEWPEIHRKIRDADKLAQIFDWRALDSVCEQRGSGKGIIVLGGAHITEEEEVMALLKRHGAA
jgi:hypothetical protein